jgi:hypothetical protein
MRADPWGNADAAPADRLPNRTWFHWSLIEPQHLYASVVAVITIAFGLLIWFAAGQPPRPCAECEIPDHVGVGLTPAADSIQIRLITCEPATVERVALFDQNGATRWEIRATEPHQETVFLTDQVFGAFEELVALDELPVSTDLTGVVEADRTYTFAFNVLDLHPNQIFYRYRLWDRTQFESAARDVACPTLDVDDTQARLLALGLLAVFGVVAYVASGRLVSAG